MYVNLLVVEKRRFVVIYRNLKPSAERKGDICHVFYGANLLFDIAVGITGPRYPWSTFLVLTIYSNYATWYWPMEGRKGAVRYPEGGRVGENARYLLYMLCGFRPQRYISYDVHLECVTGETCYSLLSSDILLFRFCVDLVLCESILVTQY